METLQITPVEDNELIVASPLFEEEYVQINNNNIVEEISSLASPLSIPANVIETGRNYQLMLRAPGFKKENIIVCVDENNILKISGEADAGHQAGYKRLEYINKSFERSFNLPANALSDEISAFYTSGIITVIIPLERYTGNF